MLRGLFSGAREAEKVISFSKSEKIYAEGIIFNMGLMNLAHLSIEDEKNYHLIAYTLKMLENRNDKLSEINIQKSVAHLFKTVSKESFKLYSETKDHEYLNAYLLVESMKASWK